jgi:hypothetical protein
MSMRRMAGAAVLAAFAWSSGFAAPAFAAPAPCPPAPEPDASDSLPLLKAALKPGGQLDTLVIGSALAASKDPAASKDTAKTGYVGEMARALEASVKGLHVSLTFDGRRFMSAADMLGVMSADLAHHHYGLVVWQTGTADAVGDEPAGDFFQALSDGAVAAAGAGSALVLVDPQYSRFLEANADLGPYLSSMQAVASTSGALLFDRYAIMHDWAEAGSIDLETAAPSARPAVAARLHACLGQALAHTLLAAVATAQ